MSATARHFYEFGPFRLYSVQGVLLRDGEAVQLGSRGMEMLRVLIENRDKAVGTGELLRLVWPDAHVADGNVKVTISLLRKALGDDRENGNRFITTRSGYGYQFVIPVVEGQEQTPESAAAAEVKTKRPESEEQAAAPVKETLPTGDRAGKKADLEGPGQGRDLPRDGQSAVEDICPNGRSQLSSHSYTSISVVSLAIIGILAAVFINRPTSTPMVTASRQLTHDRREKHGPLLTDGVRLYFCEAAPQGCALTSVPATGGETVPVPAPFPSITLFDISPDGSRLLIGSPVSIGSEMPLWVMPIGGGQPQPVDGVLARAAAWSHGGSKIAYINGSGLYTASIDGTGVHKTADVGVDAGQIRWSPDDTWLRFVEPSGNPPIARPWEVRADGTALRSILSDWGHLTGQFYGDWLANGRYYVFSIQEERGVPRIIRLWVMPERASLFGRGSSAPVRLGDDTRGFGWPVSSRDGRKLFVIGTEQSGELVRYDAREQEFVPYLNGVEARWVTFSPDRKWVAFTPYDDGTLWVVHPNGSGRTQLTFGPMYADGFAWSPDGRWIAIHALRTPKAKYKIYLIPAPKADAPVEPAQPEALLPGDQENEGIPSWSPDGRSIAYGEMDGPTSDQGSGNEVIHICDLASRQVSKLTGKKGVWTARWSPDGRYLAALTYDVRQRLELYDIKTQTWRDSGAEHINNPTWSHDSKYIYYDTQGSAPDEGIYRVRISDGKVELAAPYHGIRRADETWSGLAPDDSPIVLRDVGIQEIYALDVKWP